MGLHQTNALPGVDRLEDLKLCQDTELDKTNRENEMLMNYIDGCLATRDVGLS
jgi:hypothetical protein